jgi:hypothetical protein
MSLGCDVHRGQTVCTKIYDLVKDDVSGMLAFAIAQRKEPGSLASLRKCIGQVCASRLRVSRGLCTGPDANRFRNSLIELTLPLHLIDEETADWRDRGMAIALQRQLYMKFYNGDVRDRVWVWYHTEEDVSEDELKQELEEWAGMVFSRPSLTTSPDIAGQDQEL